MSKYSRNLKKPLKKMNCQKTVMIKIIETSEISSLHNKGISSIKSRLRFYGMLLHLVMLRKRLPR